MNSTIKKTVVSAMLASLICVATMFRVPLPVVGYVNLGDAFVLLAGWYLPLPYCVFAAGIGSGLADMLSGYAIYIPVTFIIKGLMAAVVFFGHKETFKKQRFSVLSVLSLIAAELIMVFGYYVFEGFMLGFVPALVNIPYNALQGVVGLVLGVALIKLFDKVKLL